MTEANRLALIVALFLSKFDVLAVEALGYQTWGECYQAVEARLGVKASTVKNMRDSFDPYYPNPRAGWYQRETIASRVEAMDEFGDLSFAPFLMLVRSILAPVQNDSQLKQIIESVKAPILPIPANAIEKTAPEDYVNTRGKTGRLAEMYFIELFRAAQLPFTGTLIDRRDDGCGYDFLIDGSTLQAVEVKGVSPLKGDLLFTNREWQTAQTLPNYSVFVAFNLAANKTDWGQKIIESTDLVGAVKVEQQVVQTNWRYAPNWK